jgi:hypothetical protein
MEASSSYPAALILRKDQVTDEVGAALFPELATQHHEEINCALNRGCSLERRSSRAAPTSISAVTSAVCVRPPRRRARKERLAVST